MTTCIQSTHLSMESRYLENVGMTSKEEQRHVSTWTGGKNDKIQIKGGNEKLVLQYRHNVTPHHWTCHTHTHIHVYTKTHTHTHTYHKTIQKHPLAAGQEIETFVTRTLPQPTDQPPPHCPVHKQHKISEKKHKTVVDIITDAPPPPPPP